MTVNNYIPYQAETNCVFHFTSEFETLFKILSEKALKYSYAREFFLTNTDKEIGVPCVCFSSRPLSKLKFMASYGKWGIGLSKNWARKNKLNPVFYLEPQSKVVETFNWAFEQINQEIKEVKASSKENPKHNIAYIINESIILYNSKVSIGPNKKIKTNGSSKFKMNYPFHEEKEWRSILEIRDFKDWGALMVEVNEDWENKKKELNKSIQNHALKFEFSDIEFIIANDVEKLLSRIINSVKFNSGETGINFEIEILKSKIISYKKLMNQVR